MPTPLLFWRASGLALAEQLLDDAASGFAATDLDLLQPIG